ncbi:uncharacterized protein IL334_007764 [Kwoniella shivajii]|uniref:BZIP domain-containing protein n=1 Tax=Kwoniella shivajii TaxID=564305 RepID=A0ABZ1D9J5_9TREE|nr:hypothetical protein IL334_007764 [Kwoniella shivajii]
MDIIEDIEIIDCTQPVHPIKPSPCKYERQGSILDHPVFTQLTCVPPLPRQIIKIPEARVILPFPLTDEDFDQVRVFDDELLVNLEKAKKRKRKEEKRARKRQKRDDNRRETLDRIATGIEVTVVEADIDEDTYEDMEILTVNQIEYNDYHGIAYEPSLQSSNNKSSYRPVDEEQSVIDDSSLEDQDDLRIATPSIDHLNNIEDNTSLVSEDNSLVRADGHETSPRPSTPTTLATCSKLTHSPQSSRSPSNVHPSNFAQKQPSPLANLSEGAPRESRNHSFPFESSMRIAEVTLLFEKASKDITPKGTIKSPPLQPTEKTQGYLPTPSPSPSKTASTYVGQQIPGHVGLIFGRLR